MKAKPKKIFITGGTGLLGHYLIKSFTGVHEVSCTFFPASKKSFIPYCCDKYNLDVRDSKAVLETIKNIEPDYVVHTASIANVDYVEKNKEEATSINLGGTVNVINACRETSAKLLYISSNAVFDGEDPPYSEDDPVNPLNYYGELKVKEEEEVKKSGLEYAIIRAILMYGWNLPVERKNPVTWLLDFLMAGKEVKMADDIFSNPLFAEDCVNTISKIIELDKKGLFHIGGETEMSRFEFARITAGIFGYDKELIRPVKNSFFAGIGCRPKNTTYCIDKVKRDLGVFPLTADKGLEAMKGAKYSHA